MTGMEWRDRLAEQFGCLLERWGRIEKRSGNVFVPAYADILTNILDLVLDTNLKRESREQWDCEDLSDDNRRVAVRIRFNADSSGARKTLERYKEQMLTKHYDHLVMLVLATSLRRLRESLTETYFYPERDLWSLEDLYHRIREMQDFQKAERVCEYLEQLLLVPFEEPKNLLRFAPRCTDTFIGRERELLALRDKLEEKKPIFITGIGGIGKTEVVLKMAHLYTPPKGSYLIRYDSSIDEEKEVIRQLILKADFSGYRADNNNHEQDYAERIKILREQYQDALLIIDNLDLQKKTVQDVQNENSYRDLVNSGVYLVFTTRYATDGMEIGPLDAKNLQKLMRKFYTYPTDQEDELRKLIEKVDYHTQTVVLMAQTMGRSWGRIKPADFINAFEDNLNYKRKETHQIEKLYSGPYPKINMDRNGEFSSRNIYDHLSVVFKLSGLSEQNRTILRYAALLPDDGLYEVLFQKTMADCTQKNGETFSETVNTFIAENIDSVAARGWLQKSNGILMIHPVIRNVYLRELMPTDENCRDFLNALWYRYNPKQYNEKIYRQLANLFQMATNKLQDRQGIWCLYTGVLWERLGDRERALAFFKKAEGRQNTNEDNTADLVITYIKIGAAYQALDKYSEAKDMFKRALRVAEKKLKPDYILATTLTNLGSVYSDLGEYTKAMICRKKTFDILEELYPEKHPALASAYSNIGSVYSARGDYKTSLRCNLKALEIREDRSATDSDVDENLDLAKTYNNIGGNYLHLRDYMKAQDYLMKALMIRERLLPDGHPDLVRSYNNMGGLYTQMGDDRKALEYLQKALKLRNQVSLDEYLGLATIHNNIAGLYTNLGDFEQGLKHLLEALDLQEKIIPSERPDIAQTHSNIAWIYYCMGCYKEAEEHIGKAIKIAKAVLPPDHANLDKYSRAESRFRKKRQICEGAN